MHVCKIPEAPDKEPRLRDVRELMWQEGVAGTLACQASAPTRLNSGIPLLAELAQGPLSASL